MSVSDYKVKVLKEILNLENELALKKIYQMIHQFIADFKEVADEAHEKEIVSFEEWNEQFTDDMDLNEYIPEYGCTLGEFRRAIYEAEMDGDEITMSEFKESIKTWL